MFRRNCHRWRSIQQWMSLIVMSCSGGLVISMKKANMCKLFLLLWKNFKVVGIEILVHSSRLSHITATKNFFQKGMRLANREGLFAAHSRVRFWADSSFCIVKSRLLTSRGGVFPPFSFGKHLKEFKKKKKKGRTFQTAGWVHLLNANKRCGLVC